MKMAVFVNRYWKRQKVELIKSSKDFVWVLDWLSGLKMKLSKQSFYNVFVKENPHE